MERGKARSSVGKEDRLIPRNNATDSREGVDDLLAVAIGGMLLWRLPLCRLHQPQPAPVKGDGAEEEPDELPHRRL